MSKLDYYNYSMVYLGIISIAKLFMCTLLFGHFYLEGYTLLLGGVYTVTWRGIHCYYTLLLGGVYTFTWRGIHSYSEGYTLLLGGVYTVTIHCYLEGYALLLGGL